MFHALNRNYIPFYNRGGVESEGHSRPDYGTANQTYIIDGSGEEMEGLVEMRLAHTTHAQECTSPGTRTPTSTAAWCSASIRHVACLRYLFPMPLRRFHFTITMILVECIY